MQKPTLVGFGNGSSADGKQSGKDRFIAKSKLEIRLANEKGLERLPSVNGPYLFNPSIGMVVGRQGSKEYRVALYGDK